MIEDSDEVKEEKIQTAYDKKLKLHIVLKSQFWRNGYVKELGAGFFIFTDVKIGDEPIFYVELAKVEIYTGDDG
jgi:hypothetical protein